MEEQVDAIQKRCHLLLMYDSRSNEAIGFLDISCSLTNSNIQVQVRAAVQDSTFIQLALRARYFSNWKVSIGATCFSRTSLLPVCINNLHLSESACSYEPNRRVSRPQPCHFQMKGEQELHSVATTRAEKTPHPVAVQHEAKVYSASSQQ